MSKKKTIQKTSKIPLWTTLSPEASAIIDAIGKEKEWTRPQVARHLIMRLLEDVISNRSKKDPLELIKSMRVNPVFGNLEDRD